MFLNPKADLGLTTLVMAANILYLLHRHQNPIMVDDLAKQFCRIDKLPYRECLRNRLAG